MIRNTYLDIAENDLKGYLDKIFVDEDVADLLRKDNMKKIASKLNEMRAEQD